MNSHVLQSARSRRHIQLSVQHLHLCSKVGTYCRSVLPVQYELPVRQLGLSVTDWYNRDAFRIGVLDVCSLPLVPTSHLSTHTAHLTRFGDAVSMPARADT